MTKSNCEKELQKPASVTDEEEELETEHLNTEPEEETSKDYNTLIPDGGYGWMIVFGSMLTHLIIGGIERSAGVLYLRFYDRFGESAAYTSWVTSTCSALRLVFGPLCSALAQRFSCRTVVISGTIFFSITMIISSFSTNLDFLLVTFGILGGIARSFVYAPAVMMVAMYFNKRRGIAVGLSTSGVGIGTFALPPLVEVLFDYYGFQGAFFILTGIMFNLCICGALFRPISIQRQLIAFDDRKRQKLKDLQEGLSSKEEKAHFLSHDSLNIEIKVPKQEKSNEFWSTDFKSNCSSDSGQENKSHDKALNQLSSEQYPCHKVSSKLTIVQRFRSLCKRSESKNSDKESTRLLNIEILLDLRFFTFCIAIFLFTLAFQSAFVFLPAYGRQIGASDINSAILVVVTGVADGIGRILSGIILDLKRMKQYRVIIYNVLMYFVGAVSFIIPLTNSYIQLCMVCGVYGLLIGSYISQKSVIAVDLLGPEQIISSFGILICFQGFGMLFGPPLSGFLKDVNGTYDYAFYVGGISMIAGALVLSFGNVLHAFRSNRKQTAK